MAREILLELVGIREVEDAMSVQARVWQDGILNNGIDPRGHTLPLYYEKYRQYGIDRLPDMGSVIWDGARMLNDWHWDWKSIYQLDAPAWETLLDEGAGRHEDPFLPPMGSLDPDQQASVKRFLQLSDRIGYAGGPTHALTWSDGEPLLPIPVPLSDDDRKRVLELIQKRAAEGPMPPDDESFTNDQLGNPLPPTEATPAIRHVHYWDHERKKRQTQKLGELQKGWLVTKTEQWNRDKNGWEDEGWDFGRAYTEYTESGDLIEIFAMACTVAATIVSFGAGTPAAISMGNGIKKLGQLVSATAHGQPVNTGDYLNLFFEIGKGVVSDKQVQEGLLDTISGVNAGIQALYQDITQSSAVMSITEKIEVFAQTLHNLSTQVDLNFINRIVGYLPDAMKPAFHDGASTFIMFRDGKLDRFLTDKILKRGESELQGIYGAIFRVGYFAAATSQAQSGVSGRLGAGSMMATPTALSHTQAAQTLAEGIAAMTFPELLSYLKGRYRGAASSARLVP